MSIRLAVRKTLVRSGLAALAIFGALLCTTPNAMAAYNVIISSSATNHMVFSSVTRTWTPTVSGANLSSSDLHTTLGGGNVTVTTGTSGTEAGNITVENSFTWSANNLTLDAYGSITVGTISGSGFTVMATGSAGLTLTTGSGSSDKFSCVNGANITFEYTSESLTINGAPYTLVANIATLASDIATAPSGDYALANLYNASGDGTYTTSPIVTTFTGIFEGLGNTISNLTISSPAPSVGDMMVGLFSELGTASAINDLNMTYEQITTAGVTASTTSEGGIVGYNDGGTLSNDSETNETVTANDPPGNYTYTNIVGGIVGKNVGGTLSNDSETGENLTAAESDDGSASYGAVTAGGLVGLNVDSGGSGGTLSNDTVATSTNISVTCTSCNTFLAHYINVGGLVGENDATITGSSVIANVSNAAVQGYAGGLVGYNHGVSTNEAKVEYSNAGGTVTGSVSLDGDGGLVGYNFAMTQKATIQNSYATATVGCSTYASYSAGAAGGLVGLNGGTSGGSTYYGNIQSSYATGNVSTCADDGGFIGANQGYGWIGSMSGSTTISYATGTVSNSFYGGGFVAENGGYIADAYATGGTVGALSSGGYGTGGFVGTNGYATPSGTIATITSSFSKDGIVSGLYTYVGGFAGINSTSGEIDNSYARGDVISPDGYVGGFVGINNYVSMSSIISYVYEAGSVTSSTMTATCLGGFAGSNGSSAGSSVTDAYWDTTVNSGLSDVGIGTYCESQTGGIKGETTVYLTSGVPSGFDPSIWGQSSTINDGFPYLLANPPPSSLLRSRASGDQKKSAPAGTSQAVGTGKRGPTIP